MSTSGPIDVLPLCFILVVAGLASIVQADTMASGTVFKDNNRNRTRDADEPGLPDVGVSNGRDVVVTDERGEYRIPMDNDDIVFVIKPSGYMTPVSDRNIPAFHYIHKPEGSPQHLKYEGVRPTGPLPERIDFPLTQSAESDQLKVILCGDPQPRDDTEVGYLARDIFTDLIGTDADFGLSLGDNAFDNLTTHDAYTLTVSTIGIPWHNVHGNHDMNQDGGNDQFADETWERIYGPATYSFNWGPAHFILLDNVVLEGTNEHGGGKYHAELSNDIIAFIRNDLIHVPKDKLVVLAMHIPITQVKNRAELFAILANRPHSFSMSSHLHYTEHHFLGPNEGWPGGSPHHHFVAPTSCGTWYRGAPDEYGIPHAMMRDGSPNGCTIMTIKGNEYRLTFVPARRPADDQMHIYAPDECTIAPDGEIEVLVNVYIGSERSVVRARIDDGPWSTLTRVKRADPYYIDLLASERSEQPPNGRRLSGSHESSHLWLWRLSTGELTPGARVIEAHSRDMFGHEYTKRHILRAISPAPEPNPGAGR